MKWRGTVIAREPFQPSQSPAGITTARAAAREVIINLASDGRLSVSYGGIRVLNGVCLTDVVTRDGEITGLT